MRNNTIHMKSFDEMAIDHYCTASDLNGTEKPVRKRAFRKNEAFRVACLKITAYCSKKDTVLN